MEAQGWLVHFGFDTLTRKLIVEAKRRFLQAASSQNSDAEILT